MVHFVFPSVPHPKGVSHAHFTRKLVKFFKSEDGPTAVEYAVMVALIIVVAIGAITVLGEKTSGVFTATSSAIQ